MNPEVDMHRTFWIASKLTGIRNGIQGQISRQLDGDVGNNAKYFKRAFARWIFNIVRNGKNPFTDKISANEFIITSDIEYFFTVRTNIKRVELDWSWLENEFRRIYESIPSPLSNPKVTVHNDEASDSTQISFNNISFKITFKQYVMAQKRFKLDPKLFHMYLLVMVSRYMCCGSTNNHCSVPPEIIEYCGIHTELFGSPLNTSTNQYCSPFYDIESQFGSLGSFFDFEICTGTYLLNPPYDQEIINHAVEKVIKAMDVGHEITVIIILPAWDIETQKERKIPSRGQEFPVIETLKTSKYTRSHFTLKYDVHLFYDYFISKNVAVADTHLFVMSNTIYNTTATEIANRWKTLSTPTSQIYARKLSSDD